MPPKAGAFLETIIIFLMPYFIMVAADVKEARAEILETLGSYATRTRAEMLQAAQIIALGMTTLDVLADAKSMEMSVSMRIRYRGCANGLNRATLQTEKALDQRLACDPPVADEPMPEPINDLADVPAAVEQVQATINQHRSRLPANPPAGPATREDRNKRLWASAMMDTLKQMGIPAAQQAPPAD